MLFAGGVKADGSWGGNSLFNNDAFRYEMNAAYIKGIDKEAKQALRAKLKANYGNVEMDDDQMEEVSIDTPMHLGRHSRCPLVPSTLPRASCVVSFIAPLTPSCR